MIKALQGTDLNRDKVHIRLLTSYADFVGNWINRNVLLEMDSFWSVLQWNRFNNKSVRFADFLWN